MPDLVVNPEDRFSRVVAHVVFCIVFVSAHWLQHVIIIIIIIIIMIIIHLCA